MSLAYCKHYSVLSISILSKAISIHCKSLSLVNSIPTVKPHFTSSITYVVIL